MKEVEGSADPDEFVEHCGVFAEDMETMDSLGALSCGFGLAPAITITGDAVETIKSAYVMPLPETGKEELTKQVWRRMKRAVLAVHG